MGSLADGVLTEKLRMWQSNQLFKVGLVSGGSELILSLSPKAGEHTTASRSQYMGISDFYISRLDPLVVTDFMGVCEEVWVGGWGG